MIKFIGGFALAYVTAFGYLHATHQAIRRDCGVYVANGARDVTITGGYTTGHRFGFCVDDGATGSISNTRVQP